MAQSFMTVVYKLFYESGGELIVTFDKIFWARISLIISFVSVVTTSITRQSSDLHSAIAITLIMCHKIHNVPTILVTFLLARKMFFETKTTTLPTALCLLHVSFFSLGSMNSISSVDFSPAYIAQRLFFGPLVSLLIFIMTWGLSLFAFLSILIGTAYQKSTESCPKKEEKYQMINYESRAPLNHCTQTACKNRLLELFFSPIYYSVIRSDFKILIAIRSVIQLSILCIVAIHRHHLDIWNVFAPRLIFEYGWMLFYTLVTLLVSILG
jgi:hypothetical protein